MWLKVLIVVQIIWMQSIYCDTDQLKPRLVSYQTCKLDADCKVINSFCEGNTGTSTGLCKCEEGFIIIRNRQSFDCVLPAESIESPCTYHEQCELALGNHAECDERKKCSCKYDSHYVKKKNSCYSTSNLNETCVSDENCVPNYPDDEVFCTNGRCRCGLKQKPNENGRCSVVRHLGEPCQTDDTCLSMNAVCRVECVCRVGYVMHENESYCLKAADNLMDSCTQDSQCQFFQHSECVRGRCQCKIQYHQYGNNCYSASKIGSLCKHKGECITNPALEDRVDCINSICLCKNDLESLTCGDISGSNKMIAFKILQPIGLIISTFIFLVI